MNILFSPLGKTDPIKYNHDGAMLHICRYFDIDKVYMYMSKEICDEEDKDKRFSYCLERLGELLGKKIDREFIRKDDLTDGVEKFDVFTNEFGSIINEICANMSDEDTLYLNISSGTPAMKATLQYLVTVIPYKMIPVQVTTPEKKSNSRHEVREGFDPALEWEYNEDNDNGVNRCTVSELAAYGAMVQKKMVITLLEKYDYVGAWELAKTIRSSLSVEAFDLICAAKDRYILKTDESKKIFDNYKIKSIISKAPHCTAMFEYLLRLELLVRKQEYSDFIRGMTPLLADMYEYVLNNQCSINVKDYCKSDKWERSKVETNPELLNILDDDKRDFTKLYYNNSNVLVTLIKHFVSNTAIVALCEKLRFVEEKVRNYTAHEIEYVHAETIRKKTIDKEKYPDGVAVQVIVQSIIKVFELCQSGISNNFLKSYDRMNEILKEKILQ